MYNHYTRYEGHFDFLHPSDTQACYQFFLPRPDRPEIETRSWTVPIEKDWDADMESYTPLQQAKELLEHFSRYIYCGSLEDLRKLVVYLEPYEAEDMRCYWQDRITRAENQIQGYRVQLEAWATE